MRDHILVCAVFLLAGAAAANAAPAAKTAPAAPAAPGASAAPCRTTGSYDAWLAAFEREALAQGISQRTIAAAAPSLTYDQKIVYIDRGQRVFSQTFLEFSGRMAAAYRIQRGQALIQSNAATFARIEQQFGVPAPVIVAFWGLKATSARIWAITDRSARSRRSPTIAGAAIGSARSSSTRSA